MSPESSTENYPAFAHIVFRENLNQPNHFIVPEGKRPLGKPRRRWEDNMKMDLREVGYDDRDWINLAQDRDRWQAYVRAGSLKAICK
ncbi:hypothetical protein ANN_04127 [Periplaneta americana]|uniref:Uncharacterized protein n=1 Tax=Periplaneta americana TaxID=6978 RepID=A0ABQ8T7Q2_PERAM|nr:hypothetical protein ANN_04127 [Periplaneta americana]